MAGGRGGNGAASMRREKYVPEGGPDGGDGAKGGDVVFIADPGLQTLMDFRYRRHFNAERGGNGEGGNRTGRRGEDLEVKVPPGTVVYDDGTGELMADLSAPGQRAIVAGGGRGGRGNTRFVTSANRAPRLAEKGEPGQDRWLRLELKVLADVGLVGFPNAGKSTLLSVVTAAHPKIAAYPFTTLSPNLGVVALGEGRSFAMADIPGLIEGAHEGAGLGQDFLRHIERTRVLIHVIDPFRSAAETGETSPLASQIAEWAWDDYQSINSELEQYEPALLQTPQIVAINKNDLPEVRQAYPDIEARFAAAGVRTAPVSAATREGIDHLMELTWGALAEAGPPPAFRTRLPGRQTGGAAVEAGAAPEGTAPEDAAIAGAGGETGAGMKVYRYRRKANYAVTRAGEAFTVSGEGVERLAAMTDFDSPEGFYRFDHLLERWGVTDTLRRSGAREGDTVRIGKVEFAFHDDDALDASKAGDGTERETREKPDGPAGGRGRGRRGR